MSPLRDSSLHSFSCCKYPLLCRQQQPYISDSIASNILHETRELRIILPDAYKTDSSARFEVVYICDGEWYQELVPNTYNFAQSAGYAPKVIFVLMRNRYLNGQNLRDRDFSPVNIGDSLSGGADRFYDFVTKEVVPRIENTYRVNGQRSLVGSSFSGLFSVYAFLKAPSFFQSYVASDPNINFGDGYVVKLAAKTLPGMDSAGTLFIAGLTATSRGMGSYYFDSVLKKHAPKDLKWKFVSYDDETHYSVQLKAFYDAFRFSHFGYGSAAPEFHPGNGMVKKGRSFTVISLNNNPAVRFTADGTVPTEESPLLKRDTLFTVTSPGVVKSRSFGNRATYKNEWSGEYAEGEMPGAAIGKKKSRPAGLTYAIYKGEWSSFPSVDSLKATASGKADSTFTLGRHLSAQSAMAVINGEIDVDADREYVFFVTGYDALEIMIDSKTVMSKSTPGGTHPESYIVSLGKGRHSLQLKLLHKTTTLETHFAMFKSKGAGDKWWESPVVNF